MYAAIRQGKAKSGMAEELARWIKEGAIPIISDVEGSWPIMLVYAHSTATSSQTASVSVRGAAGNGRPYRDHRPWPH